MSPKFHELMGVVKYGDENLKAILLKALLKEKTRREGEK